MGVTFLADRILFADYPFVGASVHPSGVLAAASIRDADPAAWPPEIRTLAGETLFVDASASASLSEFCARNDVVVRSRPDVWGDLLEPFLDTSFDVADQERTLSRLAEAGLSPEEIDWIRDEVRDLMISYNIDSMLWDWTHLGQHDLLKAANGTLVDPALPATMGDPVEFYRWTMEIADRGQASVLDQTADRDGTDMAGRRKGLCQCETDVDQR